MTEPRDKHPDLNELLMGIVDEGALPLAARRHLRECSSCRAEKERFEAGLAQIGRLASAYVPKPDRTVSPPAKQSITHFFSVPLWKMALTGALLVLLGVPLFLGLNSRKSPSPPNLTALLREMSEDERFRGEIVSLGQSVLPGLFLDLTEEPDSTFEEGFMEYVVPIPGAEDVSGEGRKGGGVC